MIIRLLGICQQIEQSKRCEQICRNLNLLRVNHEEIENLNKQITHKEIESVIKHVPTNKIQDQMTSHW